MQSPSWDSPIRHKQDEKFEKKKKKKNIDFGATTQ
jgi:hypothetical protein